MSQLFEHDPDIEEKYLDPNKPDELQKIIKILQKLPSMRSKSELKSLYLLLQKVEFLKDFWTNMPSRLCFALLKSLKYEHASKRNTIFKHGDDEKYFYLILKGSVYIIMPTKEEQEKPTEVISPLDLNASDESSPAAHLSYESTPYRGDRTCKRGPVHFKEDLIPRRGSFVVRRSTPIKGMMGDASPANTSRRSFFVRNDHKGEKISNFADFTPKNTGFLTPEALLALHPNHILLNTLKDKDYFGDIALRLHTKRTATVIAREECHFMILDPKTYRAIISNNILFGAKYEGDYQERLQRDMLDFFKSTSLTKDWPSSSLVGLMRHYKLITLPMNNVIFNIGDKISSIYFIKQGEVEIIKESELNPKQNSHRLNISHRRADSFDLEKRHMLSMNNTWKSQFKNACKQQIKVAIIGAAQSFGEEEILNRSHVRQSKAVVKSSSAEIIVVPISKLIENAKDPEKFRNLLMTRDAKAKWRENRENEVKEINQATLTIRKEKEKENSHRRAGSSVITFYNNETSGEASSQPPDLYSSPYSLFDKESAQIELKSRFIQQRLLKKPMYKESTTFRDQLEKDQIKSPQNSQNPDVPKSPRVLRKLLAKAFFNNATNSSNEASEQMIKKKMSIDKTYSLSKMLPPADSLEASTVISRYPSDIATGNGLALGLSPSISHLVSYNYLPNKPQEPGSIVKEQVLAPLKQTTFVKKNKAIEMMRINTSKKTAHGRPILRKLPIEETKPSLDPNAPLEFYIQSKQHIPTEKTKPGKEEIAEALSFLITPKIKVNTSSPKLITKIKSQMKSLGGSTSLIISETIVPQKVVEISKLNQLISPKNLIKKSRNHTTLPFKSVRDM